MMYRGNILNRSFLIFLSFILIYFFPGKTLAEEKIQFNGFSKDGFLYENYIDVSILQKMPDWNPDKGAPPLSQVHAVEIARKYLSENAIEFVNAEISQIQLTQFLIPKFYENKWYYNITFMKGIPVQCNPPEISNVVVFLDGTIADVTKKKIETDKEILQKMRDNLNKKLGE